MSKLFRGSQSVIQAAGRDAFGTRNWDCKPGHKIRGSRLVDAEPGYLGWLRDQLKNEVVAVPRLHEVGSVR